MDLARDYLVDGVVCRRPNLEAIVNKTSIAADDADEAVISGLPDPITIKIDGEIYEVEGGSLTITSPMPAAYRIEVDQWPYMPWGVEIVAT